MCDKCRSKREESFSGYKMERLPLPKPRVSFVRITPRKEGGHDLGTVARCQCGSDRFWSNLIQEMGSVAGGHWIAQCATCKTVYTLPYMIWDTIEK